jgi:REP element-mobilizing transposase RayT
MDTHNPRNNNNLPRLDPSSYQGFAIVFWTFVVNSRQLGWLNSEFHARMREVLLHACARYKLTCSAYVIMPDHVHLVLMGVSPESDQRKAVSLMRTHLRPLPYTWQKQAHDHVLRESEREQGSFQRVIHYLLENPVRKGLVESSGDWQYLGCALLGYPTMHPLELGYWEKFWGIYWKFRRDEQTETDRPKT